MCNDKNCLLCEHFKVRKMWKYIYLECYKSGFINCFLTMKSDIHDDYVHVDIVGRGSFESFGEKDGLLSSK